MFQKPQKFITDYDQNIDNFEGKLLPYQSEELDYPSYLDDSENANLYNPNKLLLKQNIDRSSIRDPRSKLKTINMDLKDNIGTTIASNANAEGGNKKIRKTPKKNFVEATSSGIYDYRNVKNSHNRLLHDLNNLPTEILRDTYFKTRERQLRKSRFEQRDINSHADRTKENEEVKRQLNEEKNAPINSSKSLWDLESEKELLDRNNGYWRAKRQANQTIRGIPKMTSVGK